MEILKADNVSFSYVNRYQRVCRMKKARELLRTTDKSTAEIASETGFWREEYFIIFTI